MKKSYLFWLMLAIVFHSCKSYKSIPLNNDLIVKVPNNTKTVSIDQIPGGIQNNREKLLIAAMDNTYITDNILVGVRKQIVTAENQSNRITLEDLKPQLTDTFT